MEAKEIFAQRLIKLRESNNISQQTLADNLGITRQSLSLYEQAERTINIDLLVKIAKHFNVSTNYLLGLENNEEIAVLREAADISDKNLIHTALANQIEILVKMSVNAVTPDEILTCTNALCMVTDRLERLNWGE